MAISETKGQGRRAIPTRKQESPGYRMELFLLFCV